ncbi:MAG: type IV pilus assembly protein PilM [Candidatus Eisenbacteria bacterium]|nr:type IV pilus assembly protein PilM [Candidatus Eisenbacteria bacterium]
MFTNETKRLVGLDIGSASVKLVELSRGGGEYRLENLALAIIESPGDAKACTRALASVREACSPETRRVAISVAGPHVAVRSFRFPKMGAGEVKGAVWYEGSQVIAFDLADAYVDYTVMNGVGEGSSTDVLFVAATKPEIDMKTELVAKSGFEPRIVSVDALALLEALLAQPSVDGTVAIVDVGAKVTSVGIASRGSVPFMRDIELAGDAYTKAVGDALGVGFPEAEKTKVTESDSNPAVVTAMEAVNRRLVSEVARSLAYYQSRDGGKREVGHVYLCGGGSELPHLRESLEEKVGVPVTQWSPFDNVYVDEGRFDKGTVADLAPFVALASALAMSEDAH